MNNEILQNKMEVLFWGVFRNIFLFKEIFSNFNPNITRYPEISLPVIFKSGNLLAYKSFIKVYNLNKKQLVKFIQNHFEKGIFKIKSYHHFKMFCYLNDKYLLLINSIIKKCHFDFKKIINSNIKLKHLLIITNFALSCTIINKTTNNDIITENLKQLLKKINKYDIKKFELYVIDIVSLDFNNIYFKLIKECFNILLSLNSETSLETFFNDLCTKNKVVDTTIENSEKNKKKFLLILVVSFQNPCKREKVISIFKRFNSNVFNLNKVFSMKHLLTKSKFIYWLVQNAFAIFPNQYENTVEFEADFSNNGNQSSLLKFSCDFVFLFQIFYLYNQMDTITMLLIENPRGVLLKRNWALNCRPDFLNNFIINFLDSKYIWKSEQIKKLIIQFYNLASSSGNIEFLKVLLNYKDLIGVDVKELMDKALAENNIEMVEVLSKYTKINISNIKVKSLSYYHFKNNIE
ncbi:hypothetical protein DICPUDRAFT_76200 [Dictyostelium purpureum]|uniref:Uncharacterized protein n=1 Tax=Dictyostelium purpureum TaxID=5786 RepID=F0ZCW8_DICPU|nr:uncharacterized protein DICPUDRAFT_76200 [Dictyostelium purpureum]EGC38210.1 hypothetical protein DICPUDRAFT_76200 [Dictyostelium purpureum]|eukprot:XP_003285248.1 hypothetical protein DICPUDRAFT_76200 [Dictyostelium purpureum]